jgi:hypothetical protein
VDHSKAIDVFREIQARPYGISPTPAVSSNNCFYKGSERLGVMGYTVRGRVGETSWRNSPVPKEIVDLLPDDILVTHFFTEILIDDQWRIVDPNYQNDFFTRGGECWAALNQWFQEIA